MSGWNGQFNPRLQRLERIQNSATELPKPTAADAGKVITVNQGGDGYVLAEGSGGLVEIKNVEPFQVPDLVNGGTRLFSPANDSLYIMVNEEDPYDKITDKLIVSNAVPPGFFYEEIPQGLVGNITTSWLAQEVYEISNATDIPRFCVTPSTVYRFRVDSDYYCLISPEHIVYKYTTDK